MTEDDCHIALGALVTASDDWTPEVVQLFVDRMSREDHAEAMIEVCQELGRSARSRRPGLGEVLDAYRAHPIVVAEREAEMIAANLRATDAPGEYCGGTGWVETMRGSNQFKPCSRCNPYLSDVYADETKWVKYRNGTPLEDLLTTVTRGRDGLKGEVPMPNPCKRDGRHDPDRVVSAAEGRAIAAAAYRTQMGRDIGDKPVGNPQFAITAIQALEHFDARREVWMASYADVLAAFNGDQGRTRVSLKAIGSRLTHDSQGRLTLKATEDRPESGEVLTKGPGRVVAALVPSAATQPEASEDFREAMAEVARRITGESDD